MVPRITRGLAVDVIRGIWDIGVVLKLWWMEGFCLMDLGMDFVRVLESIKGLICQRQEARKDKKA
jgi:hypothetical protein